MTYTFTYHELNTALRRLELIEHDEEATDSGNIWTAYSGRGMYGATCLGVTLDLGDAMELLFELMDPDDNNADTRSNVAELLNATERDAMGYGGTILYWRNVRIKD